MDSWHLRIHFILLIKVVTVVTTIECYDTLTKKRNGFGFWINKGNTITLKMPGSIILDLFSFLTELSVRMPSRPFLQREH